ncbi:MAG: hypothetical protein JO011_01800 [Ktedonobacteraceae bacterium]|nr:hypothetical protein [Ktedonobacteraceae bacterium]
MAPRFRPGSRSAVNLRIVLAAIPWKLLVLLPVIIALVIPTYLLGSHLGTQIFPSITRIFYAASAPAPSVIPTPPPAFPPVLPQAGSLLYTTQAGDSCDSVLTFHMNMNDAGEIFSDVKPETVKALDKTVGLDCHALQPGMTMALSPQYPLIAFGGIVQKIASNTTQQVVPTPLINVPQHPLAPDCSGGCNLTVRVAPQVEVHLLVQTTLVIHIGSWVWTQAMLARKHIPGFDNYPYADPGTSLNGMSLSACDFQVDSTHDANSLSCDQLMPNTIDDDSGAWLFSVIGPSALDHWRYRLKLPQGTRVLVWLTAQNGNLQFHPGNPVYRYDNATNRYVKI